MVPTYHSIGIIHTPFKEIEGMPIQPAGAANIQGSIEVRPEFAEGLQDLEGFSHIILIYCFHKVRKTKLTVVPFMDSKPHGVFATRAPGRPNPIGLSVVRLINIKQNILYIEKVDILDGTPLLDIKPYVPEFDCPEVSSIGWLESAKGQVRRQKSDRRFK